MINEHFQKRFSCSDVLSRAHIESSLIWFGSLKVECAIHPPLSKRAPIPNDATHMTIFS